MIEEKTLYSIVEKARKYDELLQIPSLKKELCCSFCGKSQSAVKKIIAGPHIYICNECVSLCNEILSDSDEPKETSE